MAHRPLVTTHVSGAGTVSVSKVPGVLHSITVTTAGTSITAFDHPTAASGRKVAGVGAQVGTFVFDESFLQGLTVSVSGSAVLTVTTRTRK